MKSLILHRCIPVILFSVIALTSVWAQNSDTNYFPEFTAPFADPVLRYGDGFPDAAWNDPSVMRKNGQYIMYASAADSIFTNLEVEIFRLTSNDGYTWTLNPQTPVLSPLPGSYYGAGTETPSVVFFQGQYHLYITAYPTQNIATDFIIGHGVSSDGINWQMDPTPVLESNGNSAWRGDIVAEPGALVYRDSIYLFFTGAGTSGQSIGLMRSSNGTDFDTPIQVVTIPESVYPPGDDWFGLSTPSALAINDSIYLFTDVARSVNGYWYQAALHQFKSYGDIHTWYADDAPIHTLEDFSWTNGDFQSELRSITPLLDTLGLLRIWYAGNRLADINGTDTTFNVIVDSLGNIHVDPDFWGIGTSEFQFPIVASAPNITIDENPGFKIFPNPADQWIRIEHNAFSGGSIVNALGQEVLQWPEGTTQLNIGSLENGVHYFIPKGFHKATPFNIVR